MADCAILHTGTGSSTEVTTAWIGAGWRALYGYSDGGETAKFYLPLGALSAKAVIEKTGSRSWDWWGNNNTHYWRTETTWAVRVTGWRRDPVYCAFRGPVRMGTAESAEPAYLQDLTLRLYQPLYEELIAHLEANEGDAAYALMTRQNTGAKLEQPSGGQRVTYEIPCPAALTVEIPTGTAEVPAFTGAAALMAYFSSGAMGLTRDDVAFDGTMKTIVDLYIEGGDTPIGSEEHW